MAGSYLTIHGTVINNFETKLKHKEANKYLICYYKMADWGWIYAKRIRSIRDTHKFVIEKVGKNKAGLCITGASCMGNLFVGMGKLVMGIMSLSFYLCQCFLHIWNGGCKVCLLKA